MNILAYISGYDGCGYYRIQLMAKYLNRLPDVHVKILTEYQEKDIDWSDIIVLQKQVNPKALKYIEYGKKIGKKIVTEVDDDYFNIPIWNPAYKYYQDKAEELVNFYRLSDAMTVTTNHLKKEMSKYNSNVQVIPNCLDFPYLDELEKLNEAEKKKHIRFLTNKQKVMPTAEAEKIMSNSFTIGWGGSPTHLRDLKQATSALIKTCREDSNVVVVMMACATDEILKQIPEGQLILVNPSPIFLYPKNLYNQNWSMAICPIEDNIFNRSKSNLKFLEFSSRGFPSVCSKVENYANTVLHNQNGLLTENTEEGWYSSIKNLKDNSELRKSIGSAASEYVRSNFDVSKNFINWYNFYRSLLN